MHSIIHANHSISALILLGVLACADAGGDAPEGYTEVDSAGVTIVTNQAPVWPAGIPWVVASSPVVDFATVDDTEPYQFARLSDMTRGPDGTVAIADAQAGEVRLFASTGAHITTLGGPGDGPGEFRSLGPVQFEGAERLSVMDARGVFSAFDVRDGSVLETVRFSREPPLPLAEYWRVDDDFMVRTLWASGPRADEGIIRDSTFVFRFSSEGALMDTVWATPGPEMFSSGQRLASLLFGTNGFVLPWKSGLLDHPGHRMEFMEVQGERVVRRVRVPGYDLSLDRTEVEATIERMVIDAPPEAAERLRDVFGNQPLPSHRPPAADIVVDALDHVWIARYDVPPWVEETTYWEVFDPDGRWLGGVELPPALQVFEIGEDYVLSVTLDDLDVAHPVWYTLDRSGG